MEENEREKYRGNKRIRNQWGLKEVKRGKVTTLCFLRIEKKKKRALAIVQWVGFKI